MKDVDLIRMVLIPKMEYVKKECREIAFLIKDLNASNLLSVIDYEDEINKYSYLNYDRDIE